MQENEDCLHRLLQLWYKIIGPQHHKDRDCHFFIERHFSTYKNPVWTVRHNGYILKDYEEEFATYNLALQGLLTFLVSKIAEEIHYLDANESGIDPEKLDDSKKELLNELEKIVPDIHWTPASFI
jgi:hypothetical protein